MKTATTVRTATVDTKVAKAAIAKVAKTVKTVDDLLDTAPAPKAGTHSFVKGTKLNEGIELTKAVNVETYRKSVPAIFVKHADPEVSASYKFISSLDVIKTVEKMGLVLVEARGFAVKENPEFARHELTFRSNGAKAVGGLLQQIKFSNSHNRTTKAIAEPSLMRLACSNSLLVPVSIPGVNSEFVARHHISSNKDIIGEFTKVIEEFTTVAELVKMMQAFHLTQAQQVKFAEGGVAIRQLSQNPAALILPPQQLLTVRRDDDKTEDLWTVFNRVQENIIRGGVKAQNEKGTKTMPTRPMTSIAAEQLVNRKLWALALETLATA